jgi:hypothetical protein
VTPLANNQQEQQQQPVKTSVTAIAANKADAGAAAAANTATATASMASFFAAEVESELMAALESISADEIMVVCASHCPPLPAVAAVLHDRFGVDTSHAALRNFGSLAPGVGGGGGGGAGTGAGEAETSGAAPWQAYPSFYILDP